MELISTAIPEVKLIRLDVFEDERGLFFETYDAKKFKALGLVDSFVQDSSSLSKFGGTVRGLHFQSPPHAQRKLVRVTSGRVLDIIVDIRLGSPTFGNHVAIELSAAVPTSVFVPIGFAHGFCTLENNSEVTYKMSDHYVPRSYHGLNWADPQLGIRWPVTLDSAILSAQDRLHPYLAELDTPFS
jgi:dTDP-4-dehydrorhamnose 3,5-epimerase